MSAASARAAAELLARETAWREGPVPRSLRGAPLEPGRWQIDQDAFLLHTDTGLWLHYQRGAGVTAELPADPPPGELELWLKGSVHAAAAALNGLLPLHASAVAHGGRVFAFAGPSGAGKSTLAAGLGQRALPLFCDDTLLLDLTVPQDIWCLPGHKRLKLTAAALALTGATPQESVGAMIDKFYADPPGGTVRNPLPLAALLVVEDGAEFAISPLAGGARIAQLNEDHYTTDYYAGARQLDAAAQFAHLVDLAPRIAMFRLTRPRGAFAATIAAVADWIEDYSQ